MSARTAAPDTLIDAAGRGDRVALARLLTIVERGGEPSSEVARLRVPRIPPYTVGITGAPGAGKSTLTNQLISVARRGWSVSDPAVSDPDGTAATDPDGTAATDPDGTAHRDPVDQVGVLAVDPTSPYSGGAILGDRIRMQDHALDPSVFIRSMATRGHLGGLALAVPDAVRVLGAAGFPLVVVETVGVGQMEVEVAAATDTTIVVVTPGWGDSMQANKAGLLEIADVFVVNKADRPGARARRDLEQMLNLSVPSDWRPPVLTVVANTGEGVEELWESISRHRAMLRSSGRLDERRAERVAAAPPRARLPGARRRPGARLDNAFEETVASIAAGTLDPYRGAEELLGTEGRR